MSGRVIGSNPESGKEIDESVEESKFILATNIPLGPQNYFSDATVKSIITAYIAKTEWTFKLVAKSYVELKSSKLAGRGAKQVSKALEQQKSLQNSPPIQFGGESNLISCNGAEFVMCYGTNPCFAKVVTSASSQDMDSGKSILVTPMIISPSDSRLLVPWQNNLWMAKRELIRPVK
eukprot:gene30039-37189_t